ncbi:HIT domain-containing protein [Candidatus Dependentiae bacterium]|nr:HIT domain-containing protein [Candidatus Dependentiae bacterium]
MIFENDFGYIYKDKYPVTKGHLLIIPKKHISGFFDITSEEMVFVFDLLKHGRTLILEEYPEVEGFNVGINIGSVAGQSIFHLHVHLIPRRNGDVDNPKGGVRGVIPSKMCY